MLNPRHLRNRNFTMATWRQLLAGLRLANGRKHISPATDNYIADLSQLITTVCLTAIWQIKNLPKYLLVE
jgi:hypothetical protein